MKKTSTFKKLTLILTVIAITALLALTAAAGAALTSEGTVNHGEKYEFAQASVSGTVNLKFYYSDLGSAEQIIAEVIDPATGETDETYTYVKSEIKAVTVPASVTGGENMVCYRVTVPVAPSQMTHTVRVYASSEAGEGKAIEYSVKEYCDDVLANESLSEYHNTMRAMLNWGAMAQGVFDDAESALANNGLYALGTNPIDAVTSVPFTEGSVSASENIVGESMSLALAPDDIIFRLDVKYTGSGKLTATVSRSGIEETPTTLEDLGNGVWRVSITNVGVAVFDKAYTVKVTDGEETFTATKSVMEYLSILATSADSAAQQSTAKAMYQLYVVAMNKASTTCQHQLAHRLSADADNSYAQCSLCFEVMGNAVSNKIDKYMPAEQLSDRKSMNGTITLTQETDTDGTTFVRLSNMTVNATGWASWNPIAESGSNTYTSGRYLIMKIRVNDNGLGQTYHKLYVSSQRASLLGATQGVSFKATEDAQWHVSVIDLAARVGDASGSDFVENEDGTYTIKYLQLRPFNAHQNTEGVENATMDVAYIALCDNLSDIGSLVSETNYEWSTGETSCILRNSATNVCVTHPGMKTEEMATSNVYSCSLCDHEIYRETFPESTNKYLGVNYIGTRPSGATHNITDNGISNENGTLYNRFVGKNTTGQIFWTRMGHTSDGANWPDHQINPFNVGTAKYVVVKMRGNNDISSINFRVGSIVGEASYDNYDNMKVGGVDLPQGALNGTDWTYFVVDLTKTMGGWNANADGTYNVCYLQFTFNGTSFTTSSYFDISYMAFVDNWAEIKELTGQSTVSLINASNSYVTVNAADGMCTETHAIKETVSGQTYTYSCTVCGQTLTQKTVSADVNWHSSLAEMGKWRNGLAYNQYDPINKVVFNRYTGTQADHINITGGGGNGDPTALTYDTGKYLVIKYRATTTSYFTLYVSSDPNIADDSAENKLGAQSGTALPQDEWRVAVIDLSAVTNYECNSTNQIYIMFVASAGTYTFDIAYAAVVDDFNEVETLVGTGGSYVYYGTSFANTGIDCKTGYDPSDYRLEAAEIEMAQKSNRAVDIGSVEIRNDGEFDYVRTKSLANGSTPYWPRSYQVASGTSGKYLIFKYRTNVKSGWLALYSSTQTYSAEGADLTWTDLNGDEQWHVFIVDMEKTKQSGDTFLADTNGDFSAGYIRFNLFYNAQTLADAYFDMAYVDWAKTESEAYKIADGEDIRYGYYNGSVFTTVK